MSEFKRNTIKDAITGREQEVEAYEINITNYESMIESMDATLPPALEAHRGTPPSQLPEDVRNDLILAQSNLDFREELKTRIVQEKIQMNRSMAVLAALRKQLAALPE